MPSTSHPIMETRTKRATRSLPVPLIFKSTFDRSEHRDYLHSPPATGIKPAVPLSRTKSLHPSNILPTMPYTPLSPLPYRAAVAEEDNQSDCSSPRAGAASLQSSPSTGLKRKTDDTELAASQRPAKQRIHPSRLIINPFSALQKQGVPLPYIMQKIPEVVSGFYCQDRGASCFIKSVAQRDSSVTRVKVIPSDESQKSFYLKCKSDGQTAPVADSALKESEDSVEDVYMPLHIEAVFIRAPVLAEVLLSGHVFVGDKLEIELPFPEVFPDLMRCLYTGKARKVNREKIAACMRILEGPTRA